MPERYRAMIIGCGRIAGGYNQGPDDPIVLTHALAYRRHARFDLVAAVDIDASARAAFAEQWGPLTTFATLDDALAADPAIDVASVCVSTPGHAAVLDRLAGSPIKAVFAEKPLGGEPAVARRIVERFSKAGKPLAVAYLRRWDQAMNVLKDEILAGSWGTLRAGIVVYGRGIVNNGSHAIDLLHYLLGEPLRIVAVTGCRDDGFPNDPTVDAVLASSDGCRIHLVAADGRDHALFEITLVFSKGVVEIKEGGTALLRRPIREGEIAGVMRAGAGTRERTGIDACFLHALDDIVAAIESNRPPASNGMTALPAITLAAMLRASAPTAERLS